MVALSVIEDCEDGTICMGNRYHVIYKRGYACHVIGKVLVCFSKCLVAWVSNQSHVNTSLALATKITRAFSFLFGDPDPQLW
jgi:hypothetical protein